MASSRKFYLRSVARRWKKAVEGATGKVLIFSPFITPGGVDYVLGGKRPPLCEVYTRFRAEDFLSGASSITALEGLLKQGVQLYQIPKLHAKLLIVPEKFASIGSQNLTGQGRRNREATAVLTSPRSVEKIHQLAERWIQDADEITPEQVAEMAAAIEPLKARFAEARAAAEQVDRQARRRVSVQVPLECAAEDTVQDDLDEDLDEEEEDDLDEEGEQLHAREAPSSWEADYDHDEHPDNPFEDLPDNTAPSDVRRDMRDLLTEEKDERDDPSGGDRDEVLADDEEDEPAWRPRADGQPTLFPVGPPERSNAFHSAIRQARTAREVVEAEVKLEVRPGRQRACLVAPPTATLTNWVVDGRPITLSEKHRYMCIREDNCTWGWVRVNKTVFSRIAPQLNLPSPVMLGDFLSHKFAFQVAWGARPDINGNLAITAYPEWDTKYSLPLLTAHCWFTLRQLAFEEACVNDGLIAPYRFEAERLQEWLLDNWDQFEYIMLPKIRSPFKYEKKLFGNSADAFFGPVGTRVFVHLALVEGQKVLVARQQ